jgi:hypothetical protein
VSWDGYALVLPLPAALVAQGNPWFSGVPLPPGIAPTGDMRNAHVDVFMNNIGVGHCASAPSSPLLALIALIEILHRNSLTRTPTLITGIDFMSVYP